MTMNKCISCEWFVDFGDHWDCTAEVCDRDADEDAYEDPDDLEP